MFSLSNFGILCWTGLSIEKGLMAKAAKSLILGVAQILELRKRPQHSLSGTGTHKEVKLSSPQEEVVRLVKLSIFMSYGQA